MTAQIILFNKPFHVLSQFTDHQQRANLGDFIKQAKVYPAGRLDYDSEGLMVLTDNGQLQQQISSSKFHKSYLIQVDGYAKQIQINSLLKGVKVQDYTAKAIAVQTLAGKPAFVWKRKPPIRQRKNQPTSWLTITINQGKNRQVRRMMAAVNLPVLRLIRTDIGNWNLGSLQPGQSQTVKA